MTSSGPWSVKGIDPKAREIAKDLARRSGMTLGEWLNQMITDGAAPEGVEAAADYDRGISSYGSDAYPDYSRPRPTWSEPPRRGAEPLISTHEANRIAAALDSLSARMEAAEGRSSAAINHIDRAVRAALSRLDTGEKDSTLLAQKVEGALNLIRSEQRRADDRVSRIERDDQSRTAALQSLEQAVSRIRPPTADEVAEAAAAKLADRLTQAETETRAAVEKLEASLASLDRRLTESDDRAAHMADRATAAIDTTERQLERLAEELSAQVEASRREMADKLRKIVDAGRVEVLEDAINQLSVQVSQTEKTSADAIDRMGREVMKIADAISERVTTVEQRNVNLADRLVGEVGRVAEAMEKRILRADFAQTEALQKLSGDITKVAERLGDRIARNEGRTAEVIEDVARQQRRFADAATQETGQMVSEITDRIRKSEERTARLLEETQARIEAKLAEAERRPAVRAAAPAPPPAATDPFAAMEFGASAEPPAASGPSFHSQALNPGAAQDPFAQNNVLGDPFDDDAFAGDLDLAPEPHDPFSGHQHADLSLSSRRAGMDSLRPRQAAAAPEASEFAAEGFDDPFADISAPAAPRSAFETPLGKEHEDLLAAFDAGGFEDDDFFKPSPGAGALGGAAGAHDDFAGIDDFAAPETHPSPFGGDFGDPDFLGAGPGQSESRIAPASPGKVSTRDLIARARNAARNSGGQDKPSRVRKAAKPEPVEDGEPEKKTGPFGLSLPRRKAKQGGTTVVTLVLATAISLTVTAAATGYYMLNQPGKDDGRGGANLASGDTPSAAPITDATASPGPGDPGQQLAVATTPSPAASAPPAVGAAPAPQGSADDPRTLYSAAIRQLSSDDAKTGMASLTRAAEMGYGPAQFHLSTLYDKGSAGLPRDAAKARQWAERSARAGMPLGMYNLGLWLFQGTGGPVDMPQAAMWFRKAADLGLGNAQYNLARLYENGYGVPQNPSQAYMWYLIAANGGDKEARGDADRLRAGLTPDARVAAERSANAFRAQTPAPVATAANTH